MEIGVDDVVARQLRWDKFPTDGLDALDDSTCPVVVVAKWLMEAVAAPTGHENFDLICSPL